ncbi:hypothetical protein Tco_0952605 [Tanacetum coccineum]|uniref:Uncharacterized protein n=1 Tax=Tanacetum coccineum TaxID=301880 RepID=A0ABQ5DXI3_9ASTR
MGEKTVPVLKDRYRYLLTIDACSECYVKCGKPLKEPATVTEDEEMSKEKEMTNSGFNFLSRSEIHNLHNNTTLPSELHQLPVELIKIILQESTRGTWVDNHEGQSMLLGLGKCRDTSIVQKSGISVLQLKEIDGQKQADLKVIRWDDSEEQAWKHIYMYMAQIMSFAKLEFSRKLKERPRLYDIGCYNDNLALMLAPDSDETIQEMVADLRYFNSLEHEVDTLKSQLETQKTQFLNEIDRLSREYYYVDHMNAILGIYTDLDEFTDLQCDYVETWEKLDQPPLVRAFVSTREPKNNVNQSVATFSKKTVATDSTVKKSRNITRKLYEQVSETCSWWYPKYTPPGYNWKPKSQKGNVNPNVTRGVHSIYVDSGRAQRT